MDTIIEPCPFCESDHCEMNHLSINGTIKHWVYCLNCLASGPSYESEEQARTGWNNLPVRIRKLAKEVTNLSELLKEI